MDLVAFPFHTGLKFIVCLPPTGEALTQSSLLEADGEHMTTAVEPMNLHHAMLRSPGGCLHMYDRETPIHTKDIWPYSSPAVNYNLVFCSCRSFWVSLWCCLCPVKCFSVTACDSLLITTVIRSDVIFRIFKRWTNKSGSSFEATLYCNCEVFVWCLENCYYTKMMIGSVETNSLLVACSTRYYCCLCKGNLE